MKQNVPSFRRPGDTVEVKRVVEGTKKRLQYIRGRGYRQPRSALCIHCS